MTELLQTTPASEVAAWLQYGVLGLVILAMLTGWLWTKPAVDAKDRELDRERTRRERIEGELLLLMRELTEQLRNLKR